MPPKLPELRTPFARAVVPVVGGIGFFALLGLVLWAIASTVSGGSQRGGLLTNDTFRPGSARNYAAIVAADGPLIFPDLLGTDGDRTIVLDHTGDDPLHNWRLFLAHPADRPLSCKVTQQPSTRTFVDCEGRTITVEQLARPAQGIAPIVGDDGVLTLRLTPTSQP